MIPLPSTISLVIRIRFARCAPGMGGGAFGLAPAVFACGGAPTLDRIISISSLISDVIPQAPWFCCSPAALLATLVYARGHSFV